MSTEQSAPGKIYAAIPAMIAECEPPAFTTMQPFRMLSGLRYAISDMGEVLSLNYCNTGRPRLLKPQPTPNGYRIVQIGGKARSVHRLVALAFLKRRSPSDVVNHKNGDKADNRADNLEWVSIGDNARHAYRHGLRTINAAHRARAAALGRAKRKLTQKDADDIRWLWASGRFSKEELGRMYCINRKSILLIVKNQLYVEAAR